MLGVVFVIMVAFFINGCRQTPTNPSEFEITQVPEKIKDFEWIKLKEDKSGDGQRSDSADGKAFHYFFEKEKDMLWFRFDQFSDINTESPAVSVAIDPDANQENGIGWYGANKNFKFELMLSVGPLEKRGDKFWGYNGITDEKGVNAQNWINVKQGNITFHFDKEAKSYFLGVKRSDIKADLKKFNAIGSVGQNALWNDDIGEEGYSTIELEIEK